MTHDAGAVADVLAGLEVAHAVTVAAFDKTGTLTEGKPHVVGVSAQAGFSEADVLRHAAAVERASEHPLARAIVRAADAIAPLLALYGSCPPSGSSSV